MSSEGKPTIPESEIEARELVTHEYHLRVINALVAERDEARAEVERLREALRVLPSEVELASWTSGAVANAVRQARAALHPDEKEES